MANDTKMFTCDKFLGLNEAADAATELQMGEASKMVNWAVTDDLNMTTRPGVHRVTLTGREPAPILASWTGYIGEKEFLVICDFLGKDRIWIYSTKTNIRGEYLLHASYEGSLGLTKAEGANVKFFAFSGNLYCMSSAKTIIIEEGRVYEAPVYVPLTVTGSSPHGGGKTLENINLLTNLRRIDFSADGETKDYVFPYEALSVTTLAIDNEEKTVSSMGSFDAASHTFKFNTAPVKGVGNVEFTYTTEEKATEETRQRLASMMLTECYNGSTDTRLFLAGDGTNMCFYSGVPLSGDLGQLYFPAMNEIAVDMSNSPITGMVRHYSKLMVFKPDGVYSISYEPVTLTGGDTIAGFYLRNVNKEYGNDTVGQIQTVNNYPRSLSRGGVYEWHITTAYYKDERYAQRVSDPVRQTLGKADLEKIVTCDDDFSKTYYVFLNDTAGTVLVNRYGLTKAGIWTIYRSELFRDVRHALMFAGTMFIQGSKELFYFRTTATTDDPVELGGAHLPIKAVWESGFLSFGADFRRKFSSQLYVSLHPGTNNTIKVTAQTDRRDEYMVKEIRDNRFYWPNLNFSNFSFALSSAPEIKRVRLKVKKFVYYKLILTVDEPEAIATVLGYDQQVRFSSMAK